MSKTKKQRRTTIASSTPTVRLGSAGALPHSPPRRVLLHEKAAPVGAAPVLTKVPESYRALRTFSACRPFLPRVTS